ncbi:SurA N-terminal domain-containing protein [Geothermobacter hydrogeniphilus]|uniref:Periplasmic chaperone PpiD n=1 Tax=Geothermobacter hydrogeniphilus TaxID=1969733 RepID=A0A1X0YCP3_9BACT|nr:SurA N-terminal domain-containing protein [Geothermobacter hydrogeniphilus]ORJ62990.1 hypothetical protein B5V00_02760 [Geothermobacter hydrogeniphilus]
MLDIVRAKQKSMFIKLAFAIIILSFVIGYAMLTSPTGNGDRPNDLAASVNGSKISMEEYRSAYSNIYNLYQNIYRDQFTPALEKQLNLKRQALQQLVDQRLLAQEGEKLGMEVSKKELVDAIAKIPAFQENGVFNKQRYVDVLSYQRLTPDVFEEMQRNDLLVKKVGDYLRGEVSVSDEDIEAEFRKQNEKVNLAFVRFAPALFEDKVEIKEEALKEFFQQNQEQFRIPEKVSIRYILFDPASYVDQVKLEQQDIEKYYRRHLDQFEIPEQVRASHVLIRVARDADKEVRKKKRALAEKILAEAKAGKDFAKLATKYSDDKASVAKGGDLGYFTRGTMVKSFEDAAFALKPGELSDIVTSPFGFHIIKGSGYIEAGVKPLEDVLDEVKQGLRKELARQLAYEKAMDAYNINRKAGDLDAAAKSAGLEISESGLFTRDEPVGTLGSQPELNSAAFTLQQGALARPLNLKQGVILMTLKERQESRLPELAEVRKAVEKAFRRDKSVELAQAAADKLLADLKTAGDLNAAAGAAKLKVEETGDFARSYGDFVPRIGQSADLAKQAFTLTEEKPVADQIFEINGKFIVAVLKKHSTADMAQLDDAKREELRTSLTKKKQDEVYRAKLDELKKKAQIEISPALASLMNEG